MTLFLSLSIFAVAARAHQVAWTAGMYCKNGLSTTDSPNAEYPVQPLSNLTYSDWFLHGACKQYPPPSGEYLNVPANGQFTAEIAGNRAFTTLSWGGSKATAWPDGQIHPTGWSTNMTDPKYPPSSAGCLSAPNIHCHGQVDAAGTAFAISYKNNISAVSMTDFTVFSVAPNTPYQRVVTYSVPNLPACPSGGCLCAWGWVPNHCGLSNMYMNAYRCQVTGAKTTALPVGAPKAPVWCEGYPETCVRGPKQLLAVYQKDGNNIVLPPFPAMQKDGQLPSPGYNSKVGFSAGAQTDIFLASTTTSTSKPTSTTSKSTTSTSTSTSTSSSTSSSSASSSTSLPTTSSSTSAAPTPTITSTPNVCATTTVTVTSTVTVTASASVRMRRIVHAPRGAHGHSS